MSDTPGPDSHGRTPVVALVAVPGANGAALARTFADASVPVIGAGDEWVAALNARSDEILAACQSNWWAPPEYRPHWKDDPAVGVLAQQQADDINAVSDVLVWFDPRHPLLIDLWLEQDIDVAGVVLVWDVPGSAVSTLKSDGIERLHALALWEHAVAHTLEALAGQRVFVCQRDEFEAATLDEFLQSCGLPALLTVPVVQPERTADAASHDLVSMLRGLAGFHAQFPAVSVPPLTGSSDELLRAHRTIYRVGAEAREAWLQADLHARALSRVQADLTQAMAGVNLMVEHLLNAV
ncbi:MAG TPA: hypothetical protein VHV57_07180 [Acidimicrobiales bacterium]|jgi:hypothetical protein|nr:hypothetical protein [Acidimicrobiales bacterium]